MSKIKQMPKKDRKVTVGLVQMRAGHSAEENLRRAIHGIEQAAKKGARIICLQELFESRYFPQVKTMAAFKLAAPVNPRNATVMRLAAVAKKLGVVIIASLFENDQSRYFNTAIVLDETGRYLGKYRKMHIPEDPQFHEKHYFEDGDKGFRVFHTRFATLGVLICWDQWFPEAARVLALQGAEILFYPTAIGWLPHEKKAFGKEQHQAWEMIQRSHAIANGCFVASVNRVGFEAKPDSSRGGIAFWGQSFIAGPFGGLIQKASATREEVLVASLNLQEIARTREIWPFFRDRRIKDYKLLLTKQMPTKKK